MSKVYIKSVSFNENTTKSKQLSACAWDLLKEVINLEYKIDISKLTVFYNVEKKPYFKNVPFSFNISHSEQLVAVAISNNDIGVDIQLIKKLINKKALANKINLNENISDKELILKFSALEAYYKKIGTGIYPNKLNIDLKINKQEIITYNDKEYVLSIDCADDIIINKLY